MPCKLRNPFIVMLRDKGSSDAFSSQGTNVATVRIQEIQDIVSGLRKCHLAAQIIQSGRMREAV